MARVDAIFAKRLAETPEDGWWWVRLRDQGHIMIAWVSERNVLLPGSEIPVDPRNLEFCSKITPPADLVP